MAQLYVIGRVTADFELKTSANQVPYVRFDFVERIGSREHTRSQFYQVCAWHENAKHLIKAHIRKGSLLWISGAMELEEYTRRDGVTREKRLKILMDSWGFVPVSRSSSSDDHQTVRSVENDGGQKIPEIDGEREPLPD